MILWCSFLFDMRSSLLAFIVICRFGGRVLVACVIDSYKRLLRSEAGDDEVEADGVYGTSFWEVEDNVKKSKLCNSTYSLSPCTSNSPTREILEPNFAFRVRSNRFFLATS